MKKSFLLLLCMFLAIVADAQVLKKVSIKSASASSVNSTDENAAKAIDGNYDTFWHSVWSSGQTSFPVTFTITMPEEVHLDVVRYVPRQGNSNGNWGNVEVLYRNSETGTKYVSLGSYNLNNSSNSHDFEIGMPVTYVRFSIKNGQGGWATASEIEAYQFDNTKLEAFKPYFEDDLFTTLKPEITSSEGIEDTDVKALVDNLLNDKEYENFRIAEFEPYENPYSLQAELKIKAPYCLWENPSGIYLKKGETCYVTMSGAGTDPVGLTIKNWVDNETETTYSLRNGLNKITAGSDGNVFVNYYTDNYKNAPNVKLHFINAPVRGYWDQQTMTNEDWKKMLGKLKSDNSVIIVRSEHAQLAYPVSAWKQHCPTNVDSLMTLYQQVQWAVRDILGLNKYGRQKKNRQLYYATTYGFMAAGGHGAYCNVNSLGAIMTPNSKSFDFWGVGHEWGHNNQVNGFHWSGCGETTNNITASWAQLHFTGNRSYLRLEDENSGIDEYSGMRGGRMQTYFEEGLRKGVQWQLQDGPDYHGATPDTKTVTGYDYNGNSTGQVTTTSRNYDHFVKLSPFWQLNLWGTLAGKCPDIIPMVHEGIRNINNYTSTYNTNGKQQINWMKLACDSAKIDLLPFFEKAGMLKPINAYIEDYGAGWNKISATMINNLKKHVASKGYPAFTEEINYINGHNYHIYRDNLKLSVPSTLGTGCTYSNGKVKVLHSQVKNAVAFETYNSAGELIRITMYGLGSNDAHDHTYVLYPASTNEADASAYIMAVGYDGTRKKIYQKNNVQKSISSMFCTITSTGKGNALSSGANTTIDQDGKITWSLQRAAKSASFNFLWYLEKRDNKFYLYNPQSDSYFSGNANTETKELVSKAKAPYFEVASVDETKNTYTFNMNASGQYINSYNTTGTGLWGGGASDANNIWTVEEVSNYDFTLGNSGCYLACLPVAVELPEGLSANVVGETKVLNYEGTDYTYLVLDRIEGNIVPARMPVVLAGEPGKYSLKFLADSYPIPSNTNMLKGTTLKLTGISKETLLYNATATTEAGSTGTIKLSTNYTSVPVNRAYVLTSDVGSAKQVYLQTRDFVTGVKDIEGDAKEPVLYELNGTRAGKLQNGRVYVTSEGKTILVK
ncbi:MAG: M60 family metallopeptidase [Bacteroidaceae bacterium]|nr:M60 family metallopeptidase [Bacteroidaceae bacterium]